MNASIISGGVAGPAPMTRPSTEYPTARASPSNAAVFADLIERLQKQPQAPSEETDAAAVFDDSWQASMPAARGDRGRMPQDDAAAAAAAAIAPAPAPASASGRPMTDRGDAAAASTMDASTINASTKDLRTINAAESAAASAPSHIDASAAALEGMRNIGSATPETGGMKASAPVRETTNASTSVEIGNGAQYAARSAAAPDNDRAGRAADAALALQAGKASSQQTLRGDMQALLSEFEASVRHFENAGGRWIGNARIAFHSDVLNGASVLITGNEKTLDVQIRQSVLSPLSASFGRQEKQFSEELTRRLGRTVTLHIAHVSNRLAAGDAEAQ